MTRPPGADGTRPGAGGVLPGAGGILPGGDGIPLGGDRTAAPGNFRTVGVDLAAQDTTTGLAVLDWRPGAVQVAALQVGTGNGEIIAAAAGAAVVGIDCPLGWPAGFTDLLVAHRSGTVHPADGVDSAARRSLAYRRTDFRVHERTGRWPLSVSADLIGYPAMRAAGLLAGWPAAGRPLRRSGVDSCVAEVYPAAALLRWGLPSRGYKSDPGIRSNLIAALLQQAPRLDLGTWAPLCARSADALDAVLAALVAGAVQLGRTLRPEPADLALAEEEGWIHLPDADFLTGPWGATGPPS